MQRYRPRIQRPDERAARLSTARAACGPIAAQSQSASHDERLPWISDHSPAVGNGHAMAEGTCGCMLRISQKGCILQPEHCQSATMPNCPKNATTNFAEDRLLPRRRLMFVAGHRFGESPFEGENLPLEEMVAQERDQAAQTNRKRELHGADESSIAELG